MPEKDLIKYIKSAGYQDVQRPRVDDAGMGVIFTAKIPGENGHLGPRAVHWLPMPVAQGAA